VHLKDCQLNDFDGGTGGRGGSRDLAIKEAKGLIQRKKERRQGIIKKGDI